MISRCIQLASHLLLLSISATMIVPAPANADQSDDYVACLVGRAAVALHKQRTKDSGKAIKAAYRHCKEPKDVPENELEGLADYVSMQVDAMASQ